MIGLCPSRICTSV